MRLMRYGCVLGIAMSFFAGVPAVAGMGMGGMGMGGMGMGVMPGAKSYDVCATLANDALANTEGSAFAVSAPIFPDGTIPAGGVASCAAITTQPIGTFFALGRVVAGLGASKGTDDLFFVVWHFRINGRGEFDTAGIVRSAAQFTQTIIGSTSPQVSPFFGQGTVDVLHSDAATNQFRIKVPSGPGPMKDHM